MVKVSVIVPVYNVSGYLRRCLDSLMSQTLREIEILMIDDGSTDNSGMICVGYAERDNRFRYFRKGNGGLSDARNFGMQFATGEYIGFIDSDDFVDTDMFEVMYAKAVETGADIVECNLHHTYSDYEDTEIGEHLTDKKEMLMRGRSIAWNKIYNRVWLEETGVVFPKGYIYEDIEFYAGIVPSIRKIVYVDDAFVHYVQRSDSINNAQTLKTMQILEILDHIVNDYRSRRLFEEYADALEFLFARIILLSSFKRMSGIRSVSERRMAMHAGWKKLNDTFPSWRNNPHIRSLKGKKALFLRSMNPVTYRLAGTILPIVQQLGTAV